MSQQLVTLDFETYYDQEYGLKKLTTEEYIRDPRFEVIGVGIKVNDNPTEWWAGDYAAVALRIIDWHRTTCVAHHAHFDGLILSRHFNITPYRWIDTLSMARALHGSEAGGSLAALAERYGLGKKGHEVVDAKGKHLEDFTPAELHQYGEYCKNDVELTFALLQKLMAAQGLLPARFPGSEMKLIDLTVRMFTEPSLEIDAPRLQAYLDGEVGRKQAFLESANLTAETLRSKAKLAEVFRSLGVEPPTKVSAKTGKVDFAFAKTDKEFIALLDHDNEMVRAIAEARLGMSSNIGQTRSERLLGIGTRGRLPIYLKYYGAHTGRWSGSGSVNLQNMPRKSEIRKSICAPEGDVIVVADSSQIEARTLAWLAGQHDLVQAFREDRRVYSEFASVIYERPITKADKVEDFVGKVCVLGLGYGLGHKRLREMLAMGVMGGPKLHFSEDETLAIVRKYRARNAQIAAYWKQAGEILRWLVNGTGDFQWGPMRVWGQSIVLPNGLALHYPDLRIGAEGEFSYQGRNSRVKVYGGLLVENVTQALARIIVSDQMLEVSKRGYRIASMTHDEMLVVVPEAQAEVALAEILQTMSTPPSWAADLPVSAEGDFSREYSK